MPPPSVCLIVAQGGGHNFDTKPDNPKSMILMDSAAISDENVDGWIRSGTRRVMASEVVATKDKPLV